MNKEDKKGIAIVLGIVMLIDLLTYKCPNKNANITLINDTNSTKQHSQEEVGVCVGFLGGIFVERNNNIAGKYVGITSDAYFKKYNKFPSNNEIENGMTHYNKICGIGMTSRRSSKCINHITQCCKMLNLDNSDIEEIIKINNTGYR